MMYHYLRMIMMYHNVASHFIYIYIQTSLHYLQDLAFQQPPEPPPVPRIHGNQVSLYLQVIKALPEKSLCLWDLLGKVKS